MKKVSINKDNNDSNSKLGEQISNTGIKIEQHFLSLSEREKEIKNKQYEIERLALLSKEKESIISLYENELEKHKEKIDKDFSNSRVEYYTLNKEIVEEEEKQNNKIKDLEEKIKQVYIQKDKLNKVSSDFHQQLIQLSLSDEKATSDKSKINDVVDYLNDTAYINSYADHFREQVKKIETDLAGIKQKVSEQELQNIQMQLNLAQTKSEIAELQKEEVSLRIRYLNQEQKNVAYQQKLTGKIRSSSLIEIKFKKLKKVHKKNELRMNLKIPRLQRQLSSVESSLQDHLKKIDTTKTELQNNKSDIKYIKEQETRFKSDSLIMQKRMKRKTSKYPDELKEVLKEKFRVKSKLEKDKQKFEEKQNLIATLQKKVETLNEKLITSEKCKKLINDTEKVFNVKVEQHELENKMKFSLFQEDLAQLKKINQQIAEQERLYHKLNSKFYEARDDLIDESTKRQIEVNEKEKFKSNTKKDLIKEKNKINQIKNNIDKVNLDIYNINHLMNDVQTNYQHLIGVNQYLEVHKTIVKKENEIEIIEKSQKMKRRIYDLEKQVEQKKKSNEIRRSFINRLSNNYLHVADTYGVRQDSNNIIIYPTESFSWIESYFAKMKKILFSIQTEIKFWNQKCTIPKETLLRQWLDKINV